MESIESRIPRFYDVLDTESGRLRALDAMFVATADEFGFAEIRTTAIELRERYLAATKVHPSRMFEVHRVKEGTRFILQADLAIGMSRFVADLPSPPPLKLAQIATLYRDRPPHHPGYRREFQQALFGVWGVRSPDADGEVVAAAHGMLTRVPGIEPAFVQISNQNIFNRLAAGLAQAIRFDDGGIEILRRTDLSAGDRDLLIEMFTRDRLVLSEFHVAAARFDDERIRAETTSVANVAREIVDLLPGVEVRFSLANLRGTGHYSGMNYQVFVTAPDREEPFVVADGGRIDHLCGIINGVDVPGVCMGVGTTVLAQLMNADPPRQRVAVLTEGTAPTRGAAREVRAAIVNAGMVCSIFTLPRRRWAALFKSPLYQGYGFVLVEHTGLSVRHHTAADRDRIAALLPTTTGRPGP